MIDEIKMDLEEQMGKSIESLKHQLTKVRTGRASPSVLDGVTVDYYGATTAIAQVGQVSTPEARLLQLQPFDRTMIADIEKAIMGANLGLTPSNDGNVIRIPFPALTEERRKEQVKDIKKYGEDAKISIRNSRRDKNEIVKKTEKSKEISEDDSKKFHDEIQTVTDKFTKQVDQVIEAKEKELLTL
jgi:ribosome recycling factor